ncbi:MAG: YqgE/AlgH family protein [Paracoccus sp. (in: a-proteobacteria)]
MNPDSNLTGKILIAMPEMGDPRFAHSVILICAHGDEGAMGIVLNQPLHGMSFSRLLEMMDVPGAGAAPDLSIRVGGPVEPARGFVLHPADEPLPEGAMDVGSGLALTTTRQILMDLAARRGPEQAMLALGYSGWGAGQLEDEIRANGWLTGEMDPVYAFGDPETVWGQAMKSLGIDPVMLSGQAGHA